MAWRDVIQDTISLSAGGNASSLFASVWYNTSCSCLPGTGLVELIDNTLKNGSDTSLKWKMFDTAAYHNLVTPTLVQFIGDQIGTCPAEAWLHAVYNFGALKDVQTAPQSFSSYTKNATDDELTHLLRHMYLHLPPPGQDLDLSNDLVDAVLTFCVDFYKTTNPKMKAKIIDYTNRLLTRLKGFTVPHKDSVRVRLVEMVNSWLSTNEYHSFFAASSILGKVLRGTRPSTGVFRVVLSGVYESVLVSTLTLPDTLLSSIEDASPAFENLPWDLLVERVKRARDGYQNALSLLTRASSFEPWCSKVPESYTWRDFALLKKDHALGLFVAKNYNKLQPTIQDCKDVFMATGNHDAVHLMLCVPFKDVTETQVYDRYLEIVADQGTDYSLRFQCVVAVVGKVVRLYNDCGDSNLHSVNFTQLASVLCDVQEYDMLSVCTRGVNMVPETTTGLQLHKEFLSVIVKVLEKDTTATGLLAKDLRMYAQNHLRVFVDGCLRYLVDQRLVPQLVAVCPEIRSSTLPIWSTVERMITRAVLLDFRTSGNPALLLDVSKRLKNASSATRCRVFEVVFHRTMEGLDNVLKHGRPFPLQFARNMVVLVEMSPSREDVVKLVPELDFKARRLSSTFPSVAVALLWLVRYYPRDWWHSFLASCLTKYALVFSDNRLSRAIETFLWTCYKYNHDPLPHTVCNFVPRVRILTQDVVAETNNELCVYVCSAVTKSVQASNYEVLRHITTLSPTLAKLSTRSLLNHLCQEFHSGIPEQYHMSVLFLVYDTIKLNRRVLSYKYGQELARWTLGLVPTLGYMSHCQPIVADICCELVDYLYEIDQKRASACVEVLKEYSTDTRRSRRRAPQSRLQLVTPEITKAIASFVELPTF